MGAVLGRPWMPYQRAIAEVAGELAPSGGYAHPIVALTMPRQSAKSTTAYDVALGRARGYRDYRVRYATHKGTITSERFVDWFLEVEASPVARQAKLRQSRGSESIGWPRTRSYFGAFPARDGALRSAALDLVIVDEAQEHDDVLGAALTRMIDATFSTRPRRQLWIVFSAGTEASTYARSYLDRGRDGDPLVALFDFGCPDGLDPLDPEHWADWHPGLAYGLTDRPALELALSNSAAAFTREYGNIWTKSEAPPLIPVEAWANAAPPDGWDMPAGRRALAVDVELDRSSAAIALAGPDGAIELIDDDVPPELAAGRALALAGLFDAPIALDSVGPVGTVLDELRRLIPSPAEQRRRLVVLDSRDVANAAAALLDDLAAARLTIWPHPALDAAVANAATRRLGEGFAWGKRQAGGRIAALVAITHARWGVQHLPPAPVRPEVYAAV